MPLQRFGTGFLKGLTQVAQQSKADQRAEEDKETRNRIAMAQLAISSGDPKLIESSIGALNEGFGIKPKGGRKGAGGAGGAGGAADPQSMIAQFLIGGLEREEGAAQGGQGGQGALSVSTPEETTARDVARATQLDEATIARLRRAGATPEQITQVMQQLAGVPAGPTGFAPPGAAIVSGGEITGQVPPRVSAPTPVNAQRSTGVLASDPPGTPPREFIFDPRTRQFTEQDGTPVTETIIQRSQRDPVTAEINQLRLAELESTAATGAQYKEIPSNYRTAFERATLSLPAARRGPQRNLVARLWQEGNIAGVQEMIRQSAVEGEDVTTQNRVEGRREAIRQLDDLGAVLDELEQAGVDTGPVSGRMEDVARTIGTSTDPRLAALGNQMLVALQSYRLAVTGVQFGFNESQQYEGMFPNYRNQLPVNKALLSGLRRAMSTNQAGFWKDKLGEAGAALVDAPGAAADDDSGLRLRARQFLLDSGRQTTPANIDFLLAQPNIEAQLPPAPQ